MEVETAFGYVIMLLVICFIGIILFTTFYENRAYDKACKDLGMREGFNSNFKSGYCIDHNNLAHRVVFECDLFTFEWNIKCKANLVVTDQLGGETNE